MYFSPGSVVLQHHVPIHGVNIVVLKSSLMEKWLEMPSSLGAQLYG